MGVGDGVVEGGHDHDGGGAAGGGVGGEGEVVGGGQGADPRDDGDAVVDVLADEFDEGAAFGEGEGGEFAGGAAGDDAVL